MIAIGARQYCYPIVLWKSCSLKDLQNSIEANTKTPKGSCYAGRGLQKKALPLDTQTSPLLHMGNRTYPQPGQLQRTGPFYLEKIILKLLRAKHLSGQVKRVIIWRTNVKQICLYKSWFLY